MRASWLLRFAMLLLAALVARSAAAQEAETARPRGEMLLWYKQPGNNWSEGMPLGNGIIGAMVFGGIAEERIALNDGTFWSGRPHDYNNPDAHQYFGRIRDLVFAGKFQEAEKLVDQHFFGVPAAQQAYQPLGDLLLSFDGGQPATDYRRELDLQSGIAHVSYRVGDTVLTREVFVSYPDRVLAVRLTADKPGRVSVQARFQSPYLDSAVAESDTLVMDGCWKGPIPIRNALIAPVEGNGLRFEVKLRAIPTGGRLVSREKSVRIENADAVTFLVTAATSYVNYDNISGDPAAKCEQVFSRFASVDYAALRTRHAEDYAELMGRVHLKIDGDPNGDTPTDERLRAVRGGAADPNLEALCFQFGRYLLVASSRAGGQPANLQGIWNESVSPPWGSKYTININTQMNYWPAEVTNLSECHLALFDMLKDIAVTGAKTARVYYNCGGWVVHHNIDLWRGTAPVDAAKFGMWPVGGAWLSQHLWEHYRFTGDRQFLKDYYPIMKGSAQFLLELLVEDPRHHWLVTPFSMSPEHGYYDGEGKLCFLSPAPTLDVALIRELFPHCIEASKLLGVDEEFRTKLAAALDRIPPYRINGRGFLQEWIEDWKPGTQGHNVSPDFPFYPGSSITLRGNPELARAIGKWMETRRPRGGWPTAWDLAMWARLERGDKVAACIQSIVRNSFASNLHNARSNQSDCNFGYTAGIAEALLQSHAGEISLLPALPAGWSDGSVLGLRARGGHEVSVQWKASRLVSAQVRGTTSGPCRVRYGEKTVTVPLQAGQMLKLNAELRIADDRREQQ